MRTYRIAVIPGDGIGREIVPEGIRVLEAVTGHLDFKFEYTSYPWGAEHYRDTGEFMPENGVELLKKYDAVYFGAIGHPDVDDTLPAIRYTFRVRKGCQQYVNYRPVRFIPGVKNGLGIGNPEEIDYVIIRENTEGEFAEVGNFVNPDLPHGFALQTGVFTRKGISRIAHYAFNLARGRKSKVTNVTKSNTLIHGMLFWDRVITQVREGYPDVDYEIMYVDNASANMVLNPQQFDVILTSNFIGDILSDLGTATMGSLGLGPSGNINPEKEFPSMFEPIHGSAPDIAGTGIANPVSAIWSGALMLNHLGEKAAAEIVERAIFKALGSGIWTRDLGGTASTTQMTKAVIGSLEL